MEKQKYIYTLFIMTNSVSFGVNDYRPFDKIKLQTREIQSSRVHQSKSMQVWLDHDNAKDSG